MFAMNARRYHFLCVVVMAWFIQACGQSAVTPPKTSNEERGESRPQKCAPCSFEVTQAGNRAAKREDFDEARKLFMGCPERNLPNLLALAFRDTPTREALLAWAENLESDLKPPLVGEELRTVLTVWSALGEHPRVKQLYERYLSAGYDDAEQGGAFRTYLSRGGYYEEALRSEAHYEGAIRSAGTEFDAAQSPGPYSNETILLVSAVEGFVEPLAGMGRIERAACAISILEDRGERFLDTMNQIAARACDLSARPACSWEQMSKIADTAECEAWKAATLGASVGEVQNTPMTSSAAGEDRDDHKTREDGESDADEGK